MLLLKNHVATQSGEQQTMLLSNFRKKIRTMMLSQLLSSSIVKESFIAGGEMDWIKNNN